MSGAWGRPIVDDERPHLVALGARLRDLRTAAGMRQSDVADGAGLDRSHVSRLESGGTRTRRSTIVRIVLVLVEPAVVDAEVDRLAAIAGSTLRRDDPAAEARLATRRRWRQRRDSNRIGGQDNG